MSGGNGMLIFDEDRASDSPYVERVWRSHSEGAGSFVSIAESRAEIVIAMHRGRISVWVRGPGSFWLNGSTWQVPRFDNADTFVEWLVRDGLLVVDPAVPAALHREPAGSSLRTLQR